MDEINLATAGGGSLVPAETAFRKGSLAPAPVSMLQAAENTGVVTASILGPAIFQVRRHIIPLRPAQLRLLLALWGRHTMSLTELADQTSGPATASSVKTLRNQLSRIRFHVTSVGGNPDVLIRTARTSTGNILVQAFPATWDTDAAWFDRQARDAHHAYQAEHYEQAITLTAGSLQHCPADPVPDAADIPCAQRHRQQLRDTRRALATLQAKALITTGRHWETIADLTAMTSGRRAHDTEAAMLLAIAFYRDHRTAEAAETLKRAATAMHREGLTASTRFKDVHQRIIGGTYPLSGPIGW